eukprot:262849-Prymnesium_polylepis.1
MSFSAAAAMQAVMAEMARDAAAWHELQTRLKSPEGDAVAGAVAVSIFSQALAKLLMLCTTEAETTRAREAEASTWLGPEEQARALLHGAREEAARALVGNHAAVLADVTNPSPALNINHQLLTQKNLTRVPIRDRRHVERFLRHV